MPIHAPTPPARPFDLGAIPDAAVPIPLARTSQIAPPPTRREAAATQNALYFADSAGLRMILDRRGPFARLDAQAFVPPPAAR